MTEEEFVNWCGDERHGEWVDGEVTVMSPDSIQNLKLASFLNNVIDNYVVERHLGTVLAQRGQLRFAALRRRREPDLFFISKHREAIIKENHIEGPPDLVVEIVSPESSSRDYREKFNEYESAGVREYWIVDPLAKHVEVYVLGKNRRYSQVTEKDGVLRSSVLNGFYLRPDWLWQSPLPSCLSILRELGVLK